MSELWCIHVLGPDSMIAQPDRKTAWRRAHEWNAIGIRLLEEHASEHDPMIWCVPEVWDGNAEDHAHELAEHGGEPEDIC